MSEFQETLLDTTGNWAKTLAEAFGFSLLDLRIVDEDNKPVCPRVRARVLEEITQKATTTSNDNIPR